MVRTRKSIGRGQYRSPPCSKPSAGTSGDPSSQKALGSGDRYKTIGCLADLLNQLAGMNLATVNLRKEPVSVSRALAKARDETINIRFELATMFKKTDTGGGYQLVFFGCGKDRTSQ